MKKRDLLFVMALTLIIGGIVFGIYAMAINLPFMPWIFLYVSLLGVGIFLSRWGEHLLSNSAKIQSFPKNTPPKPSKPRNPWIKVPKVEKKDKETKDDIPEIWKDRVLAGGH